MIKGCIFVLRAQNKKHSSRVFFVLLLEGLEGRVLNDSSGDCQTAPPLRPGVPENERSEFWGWMLMGNSCGIDDIHGYAVILRLSSKPYYKTQKYLFCSP